MPSHKIGSVIHSETTVVAPVPFKVNPTLLDQGIVEGYAAIFANSFKPGCFKASLDYHKACGTLPSMTWNCDPADTVGRWTAVVEDSTGLRVTGQIALNTARGGIVRQELLAGIDGLSASFVTKATDGSLITEAHVWDISFMREAALATGPEARTVAPQFSNAVDLEKWLRGNGVAKNAARKLAAGGWQRLQGDDPETEAALKALTKTLSNATYELSDRR